MVLDQISDKAKESIATNFGLGREGETSQGVAVMRSDLSVAEAAGKLSKENTGNVKEEKSPWAENTLYGAKELSQFTFSAGFPNNCLC